jgi:hypothetical protein
VPANDGGYTCFAEDGSSAARAAASKPPMIIIVWVHGGWKEHNEDWRRAVPLVPMG